MRCHYYAFSVVRQYSVTKNALVLLECKWLISYKDKPGVHTISCTLTIISYTLIGTPLHLVVQLYIHKAAMQYKEANTGKKSQFTSNIRMLLSILDVVQKGA